MGLSYHTEYRLGRRGGCIRRSYTGLRACLAIAVDLFFVLTLELMLGLAVLLLKHLVRALSILFELVIHLLVLPFRVARWVDRRLEQYLAARRARRAGPKPAWGGFDEV